MESDEKNEGISVNQPEPVERAIEDDFEIGVSIDRRLSIANIR